MQEWDGILPEPHILLCFFAASALRSISPAAALLVQVSLQNNSFAKLINVKLDINIRMFYYIQLCCFRDF